MVYIDANIFLLAILYDDEKSLRAKKVLIDISESRMKAATSALTWDEITWAIRKFVSPDKSIEEGEKFIKFPNLRIISFSQKELEESQNLMKKYNLKPRDSIHAATAIMAGEKTMISDDSDFDRIKELKRITLEEASK